MKKSSKCVDISFRLWYTLIVVVYWVNLTTKRLVMQMYARYFNGR